ncbi:MAG TPA: glycosyltransferase family 1 protein [Verrucomicrobiae bacterium]|jgi:glycosyltransferase involved in cell wall biosynthesis|nr:glycosyltransferase family 1 protein [Verrucomicrobiae bacterium]
MKIGLTTSVSGRGKTGIAQYLFALVRAFASHPEHQYVLFVLEEDQPHFAFAQSYAEIVVVPERYRPAWRDILWHQTALPRLARRLGIDVLHTPSYRRMIWSRSCPRVTTIHDLAPCRVAGKYNWPRMFYARVAARQLAHRQDAVIAVSGQTQADILHYYGLPPQRVASIHNGIDHQRFYPIHEPRSPFFLYVARLEHPAKNHCRLIEAFNRFKTETKSNWQLVFAGSDWQNAEAIHQAARASRFASDIRLLGFVPDRELPGLYRTASVFVYPSLYEGFGFPPLEAMACGCPVIASARGSLGEVLGGAAQIVNPEDIGDMASALTRTATQPDHRAALTAAGFRRAADFNWAKTAAATVKVYESAAQNLGRVSSLISSGESALSCAIVDDGHCPAAAESVRLRG